MIMGRVRFGVVLCSIVYEVLWSLCFRAAGGRRTLGIIFACPLSVFTSID
jgi:hypothetical protein